MPGVLLHSNNNNKRLKCFLRIVNFPHYMYSTLTNCNLNCLLQQYDQTMYVFSVLRKQGVCWRGGGGRIRYGENTTDIGYNQPV